MTRDDDDDGPPPQVSVSEDALLVLVGQGDQSAFRVLYGRTSARVHGLVLRVLVDPSQSEEVTQEVFLSAWQQATRFDPTRGCAMTWLLTIARRRAIDRVRASRASRARDLTVGIRDFDGVRNDVEQTAETHVEHQRVAQLMRDLPACQRQALELAYFRGLTHREAAREAGVPLGTIKSRIRDGLLTLQSRSRIETKGMDRFRLWA